MATVLFQELKRYGACCKLQTTLHSAMSGLIILYENIDKHISLLMTIKVLIKYKVIFIQSWQAANLQTF